LNRSQAIKRFPLISRSFCARALPVQISEEIKDEQNDENEAEAASTAHAATIGVTAAPEYQEEDNNNDDE
jgi:hypothetical protein